MIRLRTLPILIFALSSDVAGQQWTAVVLHPAGALYSEVSAVTASRQGGSITRASGLTEAGTWSGSAASWVALSGDPGWVFGMDENQQVGQFHGAALWRGTPASFVSLHPQGLSSSGASAVCGNIQVGEVGLPFDVFHAALWRGTPESFVDLHPTGAVRSGCSATDGILQGGSVSWPSTHATIWNGTAQSYVDLDPSGLGGSGGSHVYGMAHGVQVGDVGVAGGGFHAALWRGTPHSFTDLNPPGGSTSFYATTGQVHVGQGGIGGSTVARAIINFGNVNAWLDLHQFLTPAQYPSFSAANAVYQDGDTIYVGGYAQDPNGRNHAILWIGHVPCYANCDRSTNGPTLNVNDFMCFLNSYAAGYPLANCDQSAATPTLNVNDFMCFINRFAAGCS